jgi:hypothetical protein
VSWRLTAQQSASVAAAIRAAFFETNDPDGSAAAFGGLLANIIGPLPEEFWQEMIRSAGEPCDDANCACHTFKGRVFEALDDLRTDWIANVPMRRGGRK